MLEFAKANAKPAYVAMLVALGEQEEADQLIIEIKGKQPVICLFALKLLGNDAKIEEFIEVCKDDANYESYTGYCVA